MADDRRARAGLILLALLAAAALDTLAWWPGLMTWDAAREYGQALSGAIDDWHPPVMIELWRRLLPLARGPAPMLLVQMALYWGGIVLLAVRVGGRRAWLVAVCGLFPIAAALQGAVLKDSLMAGALLVAAGLLAPPAAGRWAHAGAIALLLFAATLRFNGFLACWPLLVAAFPSAWRRSWPRLAASIVAAVALLLVATPLANRLIGAKPSGVALSLVIFDLGGITEHARVDAFPAIPDVDDPVAVNHGCYDPALWDRYAWWGDDPCAIGFESVGAALKARHASPYLWWAGAILRHPLAYAEHRLTHLAINTRLLADGPLFPDRPQPNPYGIEVPASPLPAAIERIAGWTMATPFGWPAWWIAVALGLLIVSPRGEGGRLAALLAGSALLYGLGYAVLSVASELRYQLWTMLAALLALAIAAPDLASASRRRRVVAALPMLVVGLAGSIARL